MLFKIIYLFTFLTAAVFSVESESCSAKSNTNTNTAKEEKMISGNFSGQLPNTPGFLKLEIQKDGKTLFLNVITLHLPPAEIERFNSRITDKDGKLCFENKPKTIEPCLISASDKEIIVKLVSGGTEVSLKRIEEKED